MYHLLKIKDKTRNNIEKIDFIKYIDHIGQSDPKLNPAPVLKIGSEYKLLSAFFLKIKNNTFDMIKIKIKLNILINKFFTWKKLKHHFLKKIKLISFKLFENKILLKSILFFVYPYINIINIIINLI